MIYIYIVKYQSSIKGFNIYDYGMLVVLHSSHPLQQRLWYLTRDLPRSTHQPPTNVELFGGILAVLVALGLWLAQHEVPITPRNPEIAGLILGLTNHLESLKISSPSWGIAGRSSAFGMVGVARRSHKKHAIYMLVLSLWECNHLEVHYMLPIEW